MESGDLMIVEFAGSTHLGGCSTFGRNWLSPLDCFFKIESAVMMSSILPLVKFNLFRSLFICFSDSITQLCLFLLFIHFVFFFIFINPHLSNLLKSLKIVTFFWGIVLYSAVTYTLYISCIYTILALSFIWLSNFDKPRNSALLFMSIGKFHCKFYFFMEAAPLCQIHFFCLIQSL